MVADVGNPTRHVVLMVDIERYSARSNVLQHRAQQALTEVMQAAWDELGIVLPETLRQQSGDGQLVVRAPGGQERRVLRLASVLDRLLREHNQGLSMRARVRGATRRPPGRSISQCNGLPAARGDRCPPATRRSQEHAVPFPPAQVVLDVSD